MQDLYPRSAHDVPPSRNTSSTRSPSHPEENQARAFRHGLGLSGRGSQRDFSQPTNLNLAAPWCDPACIQPTRHLRTCHGHTVRRPSRGVALHRSSASAEKPFTMHPCVRTPSATLPCLCPFSRPLQPRRFEPPDRIARTWAPRLEAPRHTPYRLMHGFSCPPASIQGALHFNFVIQVSY